jgi:predicted transposase YdaD
MSSLKKPFDLLFKHTMGSDVALQDFLSRHLPKHVYERIDLSSVQPTKQSYVPKKLRELYSDLVCTCTLDRKEALLFFLVEHQSRESWIMPLRFIKYQAALLEDFLCGKPPETPWPIVVCACFYHGERSPYPYSTRVHDYFTDPALSAALGLFEKFHLIDLTVMEDEEMKQHGSLALMEQILKYSRDRDVFKLVSKLLEEYKGTLLGLESPLGSDYWYAVYLVVKKIFEQQGYGEEAAAELFSEKLNLSKTKEEIMNVTQAIGQEFERKGIQQGMQQEKLHIAKNMLHSNESKEKIHQFTGLSWVESEQLLREQATSKK